MRKVKRKQADKKKSVSLILKKKCNEEMFKHVLINGITSKL